MGDIILYSAVEVEQFLLNMAEADTEIIWACPKCKAINHGAYYHRETRCYQCQKFFFPRLHHRKAEDDKDKAQLEIEKKWIRNRIIDMEDKKNSLEDEIAGLECDIKELRQELKELDECMVIVG